MGAYANCAQNAGALATANYQRDVFVKVRLQKIIALAGIASRRKAEELIKSGRVAVNGTIIRQPGFQASEEDVITVDGRELKQTENKVYIMLHKPPG